MKRRDFIAGLVGTAAWPLVARAQAYPSRSTRIIVAAAAGGPTDVIARLIGQWLSERLGQTFLVENRPGANNTIGTGSVVRAPADGYTLLMANSVDAVNASLYQRLSYNFIRDIAPVARIADMPLVLVVDPSVPARSVPEFIAYAKANPGKINLGSAGLGTPDNVVGELFQMKTGVNVGHVQYRGGAPALADLLAGQVQAMFAGIGGLIEHIRDGRLRALAVASAARADVLPDVPILADDVPGVEASFWFGVGVPKNTPVEIIDRLNKEINAGLADPTLKARFADLGATLFPGSPLDFERFIAEDTAKWSPVVRFAGIHAEPQVERVRRIGVLMPGDSSVTRARFSAFIEALQALGWFEGQNALIDVRHPIGVDQTLAQAAELVRLAPDLIFATPSGLPALWQATRTIPVVFALATDPVADGFVQSLARPGGNFTGFAGSDPSSNTKLVQLLNQIAPRVTRLAYIYDSEVPGMTRFVEAGVAAAPLFGIAAKGVAVRSAADIERAIETLAQEPNGALFVASNPVVFESLDMIVKLAERHRLPTTGAYRFVPAAGGLMSWGSDDIDEVRHAASYVDRMLRGAKPVELPVQYPTKYQLVINLKAAKAIGLTVPESVLLSADEVIE